MGIVERMITVKTLIQAMSNFNDEDVTIGDWRVLDHAGDQKCVVWRGPFKRQSKAISLGEKKSTFWTIVIDIYDRPYGDGSAFIATTTDDVLDALDPYFQLSDPAKIVGATIDSGAAPYPVNDKAGSLQWLRRRLKMTVHETKSVVGGDYPS